jgi:hypothetical protein
MNRIKQLSLTIGGVLLFVAVVVAQQPPPAVEQKPPAAQVLDQLRGTVPSPAPADDAPSLQVILQRYNDMVKAAQATPAPSSAPIGPSKPKVADEVSSVAAARTPIVSTPSPRSSEADELGTIIKDLRALLARLEALAEGR